MIPQGLEKETYIDSLDIHPLFTASLDDLDLELFQQYLKYTIPKRILEIDTRRIEYQLSALRFTTTENPTVPTIFGMLFIGKKPQKFIPCAYIQYVRFDGTEMADPIQDDKEIHGTIVEQLKTLYAVFEEYCSDDYPLRALQQLACNAVIHRSYENTNAPVRVYWYDDHIAIKSPGGPFRTVHPSNFGSLGITDYRNLYLADAMKDFKYAQKFGLGIYWSRRDMEENGNPPPEFIVDENFTQVILRKKS